MNPKIIFQSWKGKVFIITVLHVVGLLGFLNYLPIEGFEKLTPFNLLISAFLMLSHHKGWNKTSVGFFIIIFLWGYFIEIIGVYTQLIFGTYYYGESLGFKLFDIPLMIGINWVILVYSTAAIAELFPVSKYVKVLIAAILMVALDYFIEPFAIKYDLWHWANEIVPLQNYVGWFVTSVLMQLLFFNLQISKNNLVAVWLYVLQMVFFTILVLG
jgi:putative membrane protein